MTPRSHFAARRVAPRRRLVALSALAGCAVFGALRLAALDESAGQSSSAARVVATEKPAPGGVVAGRVTTSNGRPLFETVVYLESTDPSRRFPAPATPAVVGQKGAQFAPALTVVAVGQAVEFRNDEDQPIEHNVFSKSKEVREFDLGLYKPNQARTVTFDKPGAVVLGCSIHREMQGVVYVCPTPFFARVAADGTYSLSGVPPGAYEVHTWQRNRRYLEHTQRIDVTAGAPVALDIVLRRN
ncbi:MAG: hypothetical protein AB7Q17_03820 [Phycisphaerae bacterium]